MNSVAVVAPTPETDTPLPWAGRVGMLSLIVAESAVFTIFVVAYLYYLGKSLSGPTPRQVLNIPVFNTICLLSSSVTIHLAVKALRDGQMAAFRSFWAATTVLGATFLLGTGREWARLIYQDGLTIQTNLFGTTYYSLVGLHAFHVSVGLFGLSIVLLLAFASRVNQEHAERCEVFAIYWHFVDTVWVLVFSVVYIIGR
jgi:cytochrome c oxidase subunit 3